MIPGGDHRTPRRPLRAVLTLLLAALVLAGCGGLPESGPVTAADPRTSRSPFTTLTANPPREGATPEEIVRGFLDASQTGFGDEFATARQFLGGTAEDTWQPRAQTRVYQNTENPALVVDDNGSITAESTLSATIDSEGHYEQNVDGQGVTLEFDLARNDDGEWRIINLEDGVLVSESTLGSQMAPAAVYFPSVDGGALVADQRYFPQQNLASWLVQAAIEGPSAWLEPAVLSPAPALTRTLARSVTVASGVATIDLNEAVLDASSLERTQLVQQLRRTIMDAIPEVTDVDVLVGGSDLLSSDPADLPTYPFESQDLFAVADGELVQLDGGISIRVEGAFAPVSGAVSSPAVAPTDTSEPPVYLDGPTRLMSASSETRSTRVLATGEDLLAPSVDRYGWVWTGERAGTGELEAVLPNGGTSTVDASWLEGTPARSIRVSREGARIAVVHETAGSVVIDVAAVQRSADGTPRSIGTTPVRVGAGLNDIFDVAWIGPTTLAVLGRADIDTAPRVYLVTIGGETTSLAPLADAVSITAGRGRNSVVVGTSDGVLHERQGTNSWRSIGSGLTDPAYPG
ncbi:LpqB [Actinomycetales bacterium JB111]|nr:LpqB [Actinomycetales bacterium JB111]